MNPNLKIQPSDSVAESRINIFRYHDYRQFLKDWVKDRKIATPEFSLRELARRAGLSAAYLPLVLSGQRGLSANAMEKLIPHLELGAREAGFLNLLRSLSEGDSEAVRKAAFEKIQKLRAYRELCHDEMEVYKYLTHWYFVAIRELVSVKGFRADPKWIQNALRGLVTLREAGEAIKFLVDNGYLEQHADGTMALRERDISAVGGVYRLALGNFHDEMLKVSEEQLKKVPSEERNVEGYTVALPTDKFDEVKKIMSEAMDKIESLSKTVKDPDRVYHMTFIAVPLSR